MNNGSMFADLEKFKDEDFIKSCIYGKVDAELYAHLLGKYRALADCDCRYCLYYGGRRKGKVTCLADECVCACLLYTSPLCFSRSFIENSQTTTSCYQ